MPVDYQEPPYDGPFDPQVYDPNVFATLANPREDPVYWCHVCRRVIVYDDRDLMRHPHIARMLSGETDK